MRRPLHWLAALSSTLLAAIPAGACPLCASETGERVRAGVFGDGFGYNLLATALPFPVLLAVVALIHFGPPKLPTRRTTDER